MTDCWELGKSFPANVLRFFADERDETPKAEAFGAQDLGALPHCGSSGWLACAKLRKEADSTRR
jgi:hypothetical protein